jgi:hypothetical protein
MVVVVPYPGAGVDSAFSWAETAVAAKYDKTRKIILILYSNVRFKL